MVNFNVMFILLQFKKKGGKKKGLCKLGSFSAKKKTPKCTQVLDYSVHFRKPSVLLCPCPLLHDEVHLQFPYLSWRVRKVLCYPSPLWWRVLVLTCKVPSSSWVSDLMALLNPVHQMVLETGSQWSEHASLRSVAPFACTLFVPLLTKLRCF